MRQIITAAHELEKRHFLISMNRLS
jgi:hypothetical protein